MEICIDINQETFDEIVELYGEAYDCDENCADRTLKNKLKERLETLIGPTLESWKKGFVMQKTIKQTYEQNRRERLEEVFNGDLEAK